MESVVREKSFSFALKIIQLYKHLINEKKENIMSKQVLRSGTAIGALIREAQHGETKKDFIHKLSIALKEANETSYWIELLYRSDYLNIDQYNYLNIDQYKGLDAEIVSILKLLTSIIKKTQDNLNSH